MRITLKEVVEHDKTKYRAGVTLDLDEDSANRLISLGAAVKTNAVDQQDNSPTPPVGNEQTSPPAPPGEAGGEEGEGESGDDPFGENADALTEKKSPDEMTVAELQAELAVLGVSTRSNASKKTLVDALKEALAAE